MKEKFQPMNLEIVRLEALDILTSSIVNASIVEIPEATVQYGETPPMNIR